MSRVHVCISITEFYEEIDDDGNSDSQKILLL